MEGKVQSFLHGTLEATIFHATPYIPPPFPFNCIFGNGKPAYVTIKIDNKKVAKTTHERDRVWNQTFQILCAHSSDATITITMKTKCTILGKFQIHAHQILSEASFINGNLPLLIESGKPNPELKLRFMLWPWFKPAEFEPSWAKMISYGEFQGLRNATFPQRSNSHVRDPQTAIPHARGVKLGELLKQKAEEGVAVRIMVWDDETSLPLIKNEGIMKTHDEDALAYFSHTKVVCKLCPRLHNKFPTIFSHHQKTITVDTKCSISPREREIMSFIGGLDLCDGRYDTEQHSLFHTLNTESHCNDFYQTNIAGSSIQKGGPRTPWHDAHACITGEAAWDVLTNFEQRWSKQCDPSVLVPASTLTNLIRQTYASKPSERGWNVQVLRSIDHVSASQLFRNLTVEQSIHEAYVKAIRGADRFIYIENQYFIGGCDLWERDQHCGCRNLIPIEIALKVVNKIKAKERFGVYIVIPMWPEGLPESESVQDILHLTRETMSMMYKLIGEAINESGTQEHPRDYLNFYCLANREVETKEDFVPPHSPHSGTQYWNAQKHRRFMVYVHSKLMIVDDAYLIIGSANINQRSMDGKRDTEIAIGCYQTIKDWDHDNKTLRMCSAGDIGAYRMSLWYEHTGRAEELYKQPESIECVKTVRHIGDQMWKTYSGEEVVDMEGVHLVTYPMSVTKDGVIEELEHGGGHFPDTKSLVKGKRSKVLLPIFTT
ncbi:hypothetical protein ACLB2K_066838 [Fragaria x ananassa]